MSKHPIIRLYADGACKLQAGGAGGWATILAADGNEKVLSGGSQNTTNNQMELTACIRGFQAILRTDVAVIVVSDSAYVVNCFKEKWYEKWRANGWISSKGDPVENKDMWKTLISLVEKFPTVQFYHIKGHLSLKNENKIAEFHEKFNQQNRVCVTEEEFRSFVTYNQRVDSLAVTERLNYE